MIDIKILTFGSPEYAESLKLRDAVLRRPLGMSLSEKDVEGEETQAHFGAFEQGRLVGCVSITPWREKGLFLLRQFAVAEEKRRAGIGRMLALAAEKHARENGAERITLQARMSVKGFYDRLGYLAISEEFIERTILHIKMEKAL